MISCVYCSWEVEAKPPTSVYNRDVEVNIKHKELRAKKEKKKDILMSLRPKWPTRPNKSLILSVFSLRTNQNKINIHNKYKSK